MKTKIALIFLSILALVPVLEARRGGGGHRSHGGHRHGGGWGRGGWGRSGWYGRGWGYGWGPSFGVTVPVGGAKYTDPGAPYYEFQRATGLDALSAPAQYLAWLNRNYPADANYWYKQFQSYRKYVNRGPAPSGAISFGVGGGYGPGWYW